MKPSKRLDKSSSSLTSKDNIKYTKVSTSSTDLASSPASTQVSTNYTRLDSNSNATNNNLDTISEQQQQPPSARHLSCNKSIDSADVTTTLSPPPPPQQPNNNDKSNNKIRRNSSLMNFKSLDINLKSIYTSLKGGTKQPPPSEKDTVKVKNEANIEHQQTDSVSTSTASIRKTPYLRIEAVDKDETQILLTYPQSPGGSQHRRSFDTNSSTFLSTHQYHDLTNSHASSAFLSVSAQNIRRSSTSDIIGNNNKQRHGSHSAHESRRPSTTDLLRRARERKGSEGRLGRSISQGGLARGAMRNRRISMAY